MKSALSTRMRMVARKPVSSSTVTQLLMMENQWICMRACNHGLLNNDRPRTPPLWLTSGHAIIATAAVGFDD